MRSEFFSQEISDTPDSYRMAAEINEMIISFLDYYADELASIYIVLVDNGAVEFSICPFVKIKSITFPRIDNKTYALIRYQRPSDDYDVLKHFSLPTEPTSPIEFSSHFISQIKPLFDLKDGIIERIGKERYNEYEWIAKTEKHSLDYLVKRRE